MMCSLPLSTAVQSPVCQVQISNPHEIAELSQQSHAQVWPNPEAQAFSIDLTHIQLIPVNFRAGDYLF